MIVRYWTTSIAYVQKAPNVVVLVLFDRKEKPRFSTAHSLLLFPFISWKVHRHEIQLHKQQESVEVERCTPDLWTGYRFDCDDREEVQSLSVMFDCYRLGLYDLHAISRPTGGPHSVCELPASQSLIPPRFLSQSFTRIETVDLISSLRLEVRSIWSIRSVDAVFLYFQSVAEMMSSCDLCMRSL